MSCDPWKCKLKRDKVYNDYTAIFLCEKHSQYYMFYYDENNILSKTEKLSYEEYEELDAEGLLHNK